MNVSVGPGPTRWPPPRNLRSNAFEPPLPPPLPLPPPPVSASGLAAVLSYAAIQPILALPPLGLPLSASGAKSANSNSPDGGMRWPRIVSDALCSPTTSMRGVPSVGSTYLSTNVSIRRSITPSILISSLPSASGSLIPNAIPFCVIGGVVMFVATCQPTMTLNLNAASEPTSAPTEPRSRSKMSA